MMKMTEGRPLNSDPPRYFKTLLLFLTYIFFVAPRRPGRVEVSFLEPVYRFLDGGEVREKPPIHLLLMYPMPALVASSEWRLGCFFVPTARLPRAVADLTVVSDLEGFTVC
jgi:hypothetical protein